MNTLPLFLGPLEYLTYDQHHTATYKLDPWPQVLTGYLQEILNDFSSEQSENNSELSANQKGQNLGNTDSSG